MAAGGLGVAAAAVVVAAVAAAGSGRPRGRCCIGLGVDASRRPPTRGNRRSVVRLAVGVSTAAPDPRGMWVCGGPTWRAGGRGGEVALAASVRPGKKKTVDGEAAATKGEGPIPTTPRRVPTDAQTTSRQVATDTQTTAQRLPNGPCPAGTSGPLRRPGGHA